MTKPPSPRPLSIKVIALGYVLAGLFGGIQLLLVMSLMLVKGLGPMASASTWVVLFVRGLLSSFLPVAIGASLWRLLEMARLTAITLNVLKVVIVGIVVAINRGILAPLLGGHNTEELILAVTILLGITEIGLETWFLIKRKSAFIKPAQSV